MANTYSQIYIHIVFAIHNREASISPAWEEQLYKYITGIITKSDQKLLAINGTENHIHLFVGMKPNCCLSDLVREIKKSSTKYIKENQLCNYKFQWQEGFGAFSYSHSQIDTVINYIKRQKEHHTQRTFKDEYLGFLRLFNIDYKNDYLFKWNE